MSKNSVYSPETENAPYVQPLVNNQRLELWRKLVGLPMILISLIMAFSALVMISITVGSMIFKGIGAALIVCICAVATGMLTARIMRRL